MWNRARTTDGDRRLDVPRRSRRARASSGAGAFDVAVEASARWQLVRRRDGRRRRRRRARPRRARRWSRAIARRTTRRSGPRSTLDVGLELSARAARRRHVPRARAAADDDFTIVVMPDTQIYTVEGRNLEKYFYDQTKWIREHRAEYNIVGVIHNGDIVNNEPLLYQWNVADNAMKTLETPEAGLPDGMPYGVGVGNHDNSSIGDNTGSTRRSSTSSSASRASRAAATTAVTTARRTTTAGSRSRRAGSTSSSSTSCTTRARSRRRSRGRADLRRCTPTRSASSTRTTCSTAGGKFGRAGEDDLRRR